MSGITQYGYERHPLAALFPPLSDERFAELKKDIAEHGQLEPIIINRQHLLIDGWNRLRVCQEIGRTPYTVFFDDIHNTEGASEADYIFSKNMMRRQLSEDQRAMIAVKFHSEEEKLEAKVRQLAGLKKGDKKPVLEDSPKREPMNTRKALAKKAEVPENKIRQAQETEKQGSDEVVDGVIAGNESLRETLKKVQAKKPKRAPRKINLLSVARETILTAADAVTDLAENKSEYPREQSRSWELFDTAVKRLQDALESCLEKSEANEVTDAEFTDVVERPLSQSHESHAV
jgi:hypothetical protein